LYVAAYAVTATRWFWRKSAKNGRLVSGAVGGFHEIPANQYLPDPEQRVEKAGGVRICMHQNGANLQTGALWIGIATACR
jgi:hypothetical protein